MKAPKRLPWASQSELAELYDMSFSPGADVESRRRGLARMSIYISSPSCPSFVHLLHSLVAAELLPYPPPRGAEEAHRMRMMMGMAIVRFVNGMVDPLQTGPYARPISHLASSLGLPPSLIALRHRATHEDLPPLPLLHQALTQCIHYLLQNSLIPLLSSSNSVPSAVTEREIATRKRVDGLLKRWKKVMKTRLRDKEVREEDASAAEVRNVKRDLEGDVAGVEGVVRSLLEAGGLVPLARRKRATTKATTPPVPSLKIWEPLLSHLASSTMPDLALTLSNQILDLLLNPAIPSSNESGAQGFDATSELVSFADSHEGVNDEEASYRWGLSVWLLYLWKKDADNDALGLVGNERRRMYRRLAVALLHKHDESILVRLHKALAQTDESLEAVAHSLSSALPDEDEGKAELKGLETAMDVDSVDFDLDEMDKRLAEFESRFMPPRSVPISEPPVSTTDESVPGWHRLSTQVWSPCPVGVPA